MLVGIAGSICSGKDTVARILVDKYGFRSYSLVDLLRDEHNRANRNIDTRQNRREFANDRRKRHGAHYFVAEAYGRARESGRDPNERVALVGLYCAGEVNYLVDHLGGLLLGVSCSLGVDERYNRYLSRRDASLSPLTVEEFRNVDAMENSGQFDADTNVSLALESAVHIFNNDGDADALVLEVDRFMASHGIEPVTRNFTLSFTGMPDVEYQKNLDLQMHFVVFSFLREQFSMSGLAEHDRMLAPLKKPSLCVREIGNQFGKKLVPPFLEVDVDRAWQEFRRIRPSTTDEELVMLTNFHEFSDIHRKLHGYLAENLGQIERAVKTNLENIKVHDRNQFEPGVQRSIKKMRKDGIEIRILPEHFGTLSAIQSDLKNSRIPLLEVLKNERIAEVNLISNTKVATIIHDAIDHVWLYSLLFDKGVLEKYSKLFASIGNPDKFDIFKREGEIVASVGYGVRYWAYTEVGFSPHVSIEQISARLDAYFDTKELEDRHLDAYRHVRNLAKDPTVRESQSLAFVFSNYLVELDEQRRKHGRIRVRNDAMEIVGELDPWSPDFLCYFVEAHRLLLDSKNKHRDNLLRAHVAIEQFLCDPATARAGNVLRLDADDLDKLDLDAVSLPAERVLWMARNYGFTAVKEEFLDLRQPEK